MHNLKGQGQEFAFFFFFWYVQKEAIKGFRQVEKIKKVLGRRKMLCDLYFEFALWRMNGGMEKGAVEEASWLDIIEARADIAWTEAMVAEIEKMGRSEIYFWRWNQQSSLIGYGKGRRKKLRITPSICLE